MHTPGAAKSLFDRCRRRLTVAARGVLHALSLTAALFSTGVVPAAISPGSNEAESAPLESPASQDAALHCDARTRLRRPSPHRCETCAFSALLPTEASRLAHTSACSLAVPQLSLGLSVPLRC